MDCIVIAQVNIDHLPDVDVSVSPYIFELAILRVKSTEAPTIN